MDHLLNKKITIDDTTRPAPEPNKKLLREIKSRSVKWLTKAEQKARREYLDELRFREDNPDV